MTECFAVRNESAQHTGQPQRALMAIGAVTIWQAKESIYPR